MGRYSPAYHSPPRRGHGGRGRSPPPRRGYGGGGHGGGDRGGRGDQGSVSLLVRNIPLRCRPEELRAPFERFGPVRDVYLPRDYHTGEPRGFGFVEFVDAYDASEAQYHMNRQMFSGREITVVLAADTRKRPEDMRRRMGPRGYSDHEGRRSSRRGRSRSYSRSRSPRPRGRARSRCTTGHTLLPPEGVMTTLLPHHVQRKSTGGHRSSPKKTMVIRSGDHILLRIEMIVVVPTMVMMRGGSLQWQQQRRTRSPGVGVAGHPARHQCRPQGHGRGRRLQPAAADVKLSGRRLL